MMNKRFIPSKVSAQGELSRYSGKAELQTRKLRRWLELGNLATISARQYCVY